MCYLQMDSAEHKEYAGAQNADSRKMEEKSGADRLERILSREILNRAYKRVKSNHGAPGIDGMNIEAAMPWPKEHREELLDSIRKGKYKPQSVGRKEIPKPNGGTRKLGIPTVVDRIIQQAIAQELVPICEPLFSENSYGYRPNRSAQQVIRKVKEYAEEGYTQAVLVELSKYFDTMNHDLMLELLRRTIHDEHVVQLIKKYLRAGVMENGVVVKTEDGSPQGGPLSLLLVNIYLNEYDLEMKKHGVPMTRYADDIVVLARSQRAAERLLETTKRYLEGKRMKLRVNAEKSKVVSVYSIRNFKFLGLALGRGKNGTYIRAHEKYRKKAKAKLKELTFRSQGRNVRMVIQRVNAYTRGWIGYFGIAHMKAPLQEWDGWLRRRLRMYIWKQWKKPRTRKENLMKLGLSEWRACEVAYSRKAYWRAAKYAGVQTAISNKRLAQAGYESILDRYESLR